MVHVVHSLLGSHDAGDLRQRLGLSSCRLERAKYARKCAQRARRGWTRRIDVAVLCRLCTNETTVCMLRDRTVPLRGVMTISLLAPPEPEG